MNQQLVWSMLLLILLTLSNSVTTQECLTGQLGGFDGNLSDTIQYCYNGEWRSICHQGSQWDTEIVRDVCRQLGFNSTGDCTPGNLRLVNGSTEREGLVEVCMGENPNNTHWRTVCTNSSQQLAGAVCAQLGYLFEGGTVATQNTFQSGKFPEYRLNCELTDDGGYWICEATRKECSSAVEYGVVCKTYEELYNDCLSSSNTAQTTSSMAGIGVLAAVLAGVIVGWIVTSVVLLRKIRVTGGQKQHESTAITKMSKNQSYKQQEIRNTADQSKVAEGTYNRLSRDQAESYMIGDVTYDYADHEIRIKSSSVPDHPPSVGGVSNDEFYNAEDHTYTAVDKKNKKSQRVYEEGNLSEHVKGINSAMHT